MSNFVQNSLKFLVSVRKFCIKHFSTKNVDIDQGISLFEWYQEYVKDNILTKLQEFFDFGSTLDYQRKLIINMHLSM